MFSNKKFNPFYLIIFGLLLLPAAGALWFGFYSISPLPMDNFWYERVGLQTGTVPFYIAFVFHLLGSTKGMAIVSALTMVVLFLLRRWWHAIALATTMVSVLVASKTIKFLVDRPRPTDMLVIETETSFPSGHSLGAGAIATVLVIFVLASPRSGRSARVISVVLGSAYILTMVWSRTALHVHWLSDTIAGALLGVALGLFFTHLLLPRESLSPEGHFRHTIHSPKHL